MNKRCNICGCVKDSSAFYKRKASKDGRRAECKDCSVDMVKAYHKTKLGKIAKIYNHQKQTSISRGHKLPNYKLEELREWALSQNTFHKLYEDWVISGYDRWSSPSFDRIDDYKPYTLDNLQITTALYNLEKAHSDEMNGVNTKRCVSVCVCKYDGTPLIKFHSIRDASRKTGISHFDISKASSGIIKYAGGRKWIRI